MREEFLLIFSSGLYVISFGFGVLLNMNNVVMVGLLLSIKKDYRVNYPVGYELQNKSNAVLIFD